MIWMRFKVINRSDSAHFFIEAVNPFINEILFYHVDGRNKRLLRSDTTGTNYEFEKRPSKNFRNFLFPANIPKGDSAWLYMRVASDVPLHLRVLIFEENERTRGGFQSWIVDVLMTVFYTFTMLFLILLGILIVISKENFHWYYFAYVLLTGLFIPAHLGLGFMYIWKENGDLQHVVPMALNNLRLVCGIQFFRWYFDLPKIEPQFNRFIRVSIGVFLFILLLQIARGALGWGFVKEFFLLFLVFLALFSLTMLAWLVREMLFKKRRRFSWVLLVVALNIVGVGITSLQHLGFGSTGYDLSDRILAVFGIANTFFLSPFVIAAFFVEMVLVFNFGVRRYLRLVEKNQKAELRIARAREEGLKALIIGVENERKRIARDLHDGACVNLAAINMKMDALREEHPANPALVSKITDIADDLDQTYREVRGISHELMSKTLDATGLQTALEELAVRIQQAQKGLSVNFYANYPLDRVNDLAKIHLYRIAQELLANVLKHAHASHVNIQVLEDEGNLLLTVEDDGRGFVAAKALANGGIGLANVRARVEVLHGKLHLDSASGKGTFISIEIPRTSMA
jgi:signal transduction histidine kinase